MKGVRHNNYAQRPLVLKAKKGSIKPGHKWVTRKVGKGGKHQYTYASTEKWKVRIPDNHIGAWVVAETSSKKAMRAKKADEHEQAKNGLNIAANYYDQLRQMYSIRAHRNTANNKKFYADYLLSRAFGEMAGRLRNRVGLHVEVMRTKGQRKIKGITKSMVMIKARPYKYIKKEKGKGGKFRYYYHDELIRRAILTPKQIAHSLRGELSSDYARKEGTEKSHRAAMNLNRRAKALYHRLYTHYHRKTEDLIHFPEVRPCTVASTYARAMLYLSKKHEKLEQRHERWLVKKHYVPKPKEVKAASVGEGLADKKNLSESKVDPKEMRLGMKVEAEHTSDRKKQHEIAMDHLAEDSKYYSKLITWERKGKKKKAQKSDQFYTRLEKTNGAK